MSDMEEIRALKLEMLDSIKRRRTGDATDHFTISVTALAELLADLIFAAAKDEAHGHRLKAIADKMVISRWRHLAAGEV